MRGLTLRATLVLVALALGLAFSVGALAGGGSSATKPAEGGPGVVTSTPGTAPDPQLSAARTVPALRDPQRPRERPLRVATPERVEGPAARPAPTLARPPVVRDAPATPTPTAVPRRPAPAPRLVAPAPRSTPEPTATAAPEPTGEFDTTGEP